MATIRAVKTGILHKHGDTGSNLRRPTWSAAEVHRLVQKTMLARREILPLRSVRRKIGAIEAACGNRGTFT
ncbi:MAG TPA: hypothetical protein EYQ63_08055 [Fuerstia sp.]|nr:hypothetical protein [Fuerstiella sp.]